MRKGMKKPHLGANRSKEKGFAGLFPYFRP